MEVVYYLIDTYKATEFDERTKEWWPVKHEWLVISICLSYLYFVLKCGPKYMENRAPYSCKTFIKYYNIFQIIYNSWLVYGSIKYGMFSDIGLGCHLVDRSPEGKPMELAKIIFWTEILKIIDFSETVIFILRKKNRQISFLHVYHHISTVYLSQISTKYFPGGMAIFPLILNSSIHVIMYTYYLLSSQGPKVQKIIIPFKPYITIMQMVQFFVLIGHTLQVFTPYCNVPKWGAVVMLTNLVINFFLFYNFYQKNYKPNKAEADKANADKAKAKKAS